MARNVNMSQTPCKHLSSSMPYLMWKTQPQAMVPSWKYMKQTDLTCTKHNLTRMLPAAKLSAHNTARKRDRDNKGNLGILWETPVALDQLIRAPVHLLIFTTQSGACVKWHSARDLLASAVTGAVFTLHTFIKATDEQDELNQCIKCKDSHWRLKTQYKQMVIKKPQNYTQRNLWHENIWWSWDWQHSTARPQVQPSHVYFTERWSVSLVFLALLINLLPRHWTLLIYFIYLFLRVAAMEGIDGDLTSQNTTA